MVRVLLALADVGIAVQLQESLGAAGVDATWDAARAGGPSEDEGTMPEVVLLCDDPEGVPLEKAVRSWRDAVPPPGIIALVFTAEDRSAAARARVSSLPGDAAHEDMVRAIERAAELRFSSGLEAASPREVALHALGLAPSADEDEGTIRIIAAAREADIETVREALRWHAQDYVAADVQVIEMLRAHRALEIPEVEFANLLDGTRTLQTVVKSQAINAWQGARLVWALASTGVLTFSPEPPDLSTSARRGVAAARFHLRARRARLEKATFFDVLEVLPDATQGQFDYAYEMVAQRYSPSRFESMDLGSVTPLVNPIWEEITKAHTTLSRWGDRKEYMDWIAAQGSKLQSHWMVDGTDARRAADALAIGQKALLEGNVFKAVSDMAAACRLHPQHPEYEASLCWARYRADVTGGKDRAQVAGRERAIAERTLAGCRPWPRALLALGLLCTADGDADAARWHLREALAVDPNLPAAKQILQRLR